MLYLFLDKNQIKLLYVKKTLLGQYESAFYEKKHTIDFLDENGQIVNTDLLASAIKEATSTISPGGVKDKETFLILPQSSFLFMRTEVPADIAPTAVDSFVKDKARAMMHKDLDNYLHDYLVQDNEKQKHVVFFAFDKESLKIYQETLALVDLTIVNILPESLGYFKLFEKTLRSDKRENILYVLYTNDVTTGYLYDSFGPVENTRWREMVDPTTIEEFLKNKATEYETQGKKLNRLILSGENSDAIRQDTFTKNVGVWTNPLKRIIPHFYQDYLKIFIIPSDKTLPLLQYDVCIGAFIFSLENKGFSMLKKKYSSFSAPSLSSRSFSLPKKEIVIFASSFALSFLVFLGVSKLSANDMLPKTPTFFAAEPTATPTPVPPTPTPAPAVNRKEVKVKVLNGSGVKGKATEVKDLLKEKGYEEILTANADNFDYTTTEIQVKEGKDELAKAMEEDLKDYVKSPKVSELDAEEASDIVLIFGADFK